MHEFVPSDLNQLLTIEVYLPKNLRNYGALITLLSELIEFRSAKAWMVKKAKTLYGMNVRIADLPDETGEMLESNDIARLTSLLAERGFPLASSVEVLGENGKFSVRIKGTTRCYLEKSAQGWGIHLPIWNRGRAPKGRVGAFPTTNEAYRRLQGSDWSLTDFTSSLENLEKTIAGYSIYEVDGAFESTNVNRAIPIDPRCSIEEQIVDALRRGDDAPLRCALESANLPCRGEIRGPASGWQIREGDNLLSIGESTLLLSKVDSEYHICAATRVLEERTCVIRFMADIGPASGIVPALGGESFRATGTVTDKKLWDTVLMIGLFFVYNLGTRVGIEDEIWMVFNTSAVLWPWKKGSVVRSSLDANTLFQ